MDTFFGLQSKPEGGNMDNLFEKMEGGVPVKKTAKKKAIVKTRKMKVGMPKPKGRKHASSSASPRDENAMVLQRTHSEMGRPMAISTSDAMVLQRSTSGPMATYITPADLLTGTPQTPYDKTRPSEITIYLAGHGEEYFPRKGGDVNFPKILLDLIESKKMRVRMVNKVNAPLVEGIAMSYVNNGKVLLKTEDEFYKDAMNYFKKNRKMDTKKIMKMLGKDYIAKYKDYLDNIAEKMPGKEKEHYDRVKLKKEILKKSNYLDLYRPTHEKMFYVRPMTVVDPQNKDDSIMIRYGMYVVDIRNSPHGNVFFQGLNLTPMHEEYSQNKSMYLDMISYLKMLFCSYDSPNALDQYRHNTCNAIEYIISPENKLPIIKLSDILILFYSLGFTNINIIDSTCRVDCGSNTGVCSHYQIPNLQECSYNMKKSLIEIAKLKKDLVISPYSKSSSPETGDNKGKVGITRKKTQHKKAQVSTANIAKRFTQKMK
jgi:hypothetical protein